MYFFQDHIRAAMTCIQAFYLSGAKQYSDLNSRLKHLQQALRHFQTYLNPGKLEKATRTRPALDSQGPDSTNLRLSQTESEARMYDTLHYIYNITTALYCFIPM